MARHNAPDRRSHLQSETRPLSTAEILQLPQATVDEARAELAEIMAPLESTGERGTADDA
jgi:hypothetical protein